MHEAVALLRGRLIVNREYNVNRKRFMLLVQFERSALLCTKSAEIPPTAVGGWLIRNLQTSAATEQEFHRRSRWIVHTQPHASLCLCLKDWKGSICNGSSVRYEQSTDFVDGICRFAFSSRSSRPSMKP